jgi:hypothetical protein
MQRVTKSVLSLFLLAALAVLSGGPVSGQMVRTRDKSREYERTTAPPEAQAEPRRKVPTTPAPAPVERTAPGAVNDMVASIQEVLASPRHDAVAISFWTAQGVTPTVELGIARPTVTEGRWLFRSGRSTGQGTAVAAQRTGPLSKKVGTIANTFYTFDSSQAHLLPLEQGKTYFFIISIASRNGQGSFQTTGSFTTWTRIVKVFFESIKIISDGDPDPPPPLPADCGEIDLWCWANYGQPGEQFLPIPKLGPGTIGACSGKTYDLRRELVIDKAPDTLSLSVSGRDRDSNDYAGADLFGPSRPAPVDGPRDTGDDERNVARGEFDLRQFGPGTTRRFPLASIRAGGGSAGDLMFEVTVRIEVKYLDQEGRETRATIPPTRPGNAGFEE